MRVARAARRPAPRSPRRARRSGGRSPVRARQGARHLGERRALHLCEGRQPSCHGRVFAARRRRRDERSLRRARWSGRRARRGLVEDQPLPLPRPAARARLVVRYRPDAATRSRSTKRYHEPTAARAAVVRHVRVRRAGRVHRGARDAADRHGQSAAAAPQPRRRRRRRRRSAARVAGGARVHGQRDPQHSRRGGPAGAVQGAVAGAAPAAALCVAAGGPVRAGACRARARDGGARAAVASRLHAGSSCGRPPSRPALYAAPLRRQ